MSTETLKDAVAKELNLRSQLFQFFAGWGDHLFFQTNDRVLWACGENNFGQLSLGTKKDVLSPVKVGFFIPGSKKEILGVSIGGFHSLFVTICSEAFSTGRNDDSQLSDSTTEDRSLAVPVVLEDEKANIRSVVAGLCCSYLLSVEGEVFSAGLNNFGQLGHNNKENVSIGKKILSLSDIVQIVTGSQWVIFRSKKSNALFGCGCNYGQFGIGNRDNYQLVPVEISFFKERNIKIDFLVSSQFTAYFVTSDNQVFCSGSGDDGEFGNGGKTSSGVPVLSRPLSGFQVFCSGNTFKFVVMKKNDRIYACGYKSGRYGYSNLFGKTGDHSKPVEIKSLRGKNVKQIVTRRFGTYAICGDGSIFATGDRGKYGAMMNGKEGDSKKFIHVGKYDLKINPSIEKLEEEERKAKMEKERKEKERKKREKEEEKEKRRKEEEERKKKEEEERKRSEEAEKKKEELELRKKKEEEREREENFQRRLEEQREKMEEERRKMEDKIRKEMEKEHKRERERFRKEMEKEHKRKAEEEKKKKLERKLKKAMISISHVTKGRRIGRGAMGEVYDGIWTKSGGRTPVAIKELSLKKSLVLEDLEEFFVMYKCRHLMVLPVFGFCHSPEEQIVWIVMKKMHASLFKYLYGIRKGGLKLSEKLDLMEKVTSCIQYLHLKEQIIHRDIKSLNFLVNKTGSELCVTDFGLVKSRNSQTFVKTSEDVETARTKGQGTQRWMSPEILDYPAKYSIFSDIYALAMVFYEILNQKVPFDDEYSSGAMNDRNFDRAVMKGVRPKFKEDVPKEFVELVEKCWVHEAKKRLTTEEILKEIEKLKGVLVEDIGAAFFMSNRE